MDRSRPSFMTKEQLDKYLTDLRQSRTVKARVASNLDQGVSKRWSLSEIPRADTVSSGATCSNPVNEANNREEADNYTHRRSSTFGNGVGYGSMRSSRPERGQRGGWKTNNGWIKPARSNILDSTAERGLSASGPQSNSNGNIQTTHALPSKPLQNRTADSGNRGQIVPLQQEEQISTTMKQEPMPSSCDLNPTIELQEDEDDPGYLPEEPIAPAPLRITKAKPIDNNSRLHSSQRPEATPEVTNNNKIAYTANTAPNPGSGPPELEQRPKWNDMAIPTHSPQRPQTPPTKVMMVEDGKVVGEMVMEQEIDESKLTLAQGNPWSKGVRPSPEVARLGMAMEKKLSGGSTHPQIQSMTFEEFAAMDLKVGTGGAKTDSVPGQSTLVSQPVNSTMERKPRRESSGAQVFSSPSIEIEASQQRLEQLRLDKQGKATELEQTSNTSYRPEPLQSRSSPPSASQQYVRPAPNQLSGPRMNPRQPLRSPQPQQQQQQPSDVSVSQEAPTTSSQASQRSMRWQQPSGRQQQQGQNIAQRAPQQDHQSRPQQQQPIPVISLPDETPINNNSRLRQPPISTFSFSEESQEQRQQHAHHHQHDQGFQRQQQHQQKPVQQPPIPTFSFSEEPWTSRPTPSQQPPVPTISFSEEPSASSRGSSQQQPPIPTISFSEDTLAHNQPPVSQRPLPSVSVTSDMGYQRNSRPLPNTIPQSNGSRPLPPPKDHTTPGNRSYDPYNTHYNHSSTRIPQSKAICTACRHPITSRAVNAMNFHFHPECFSCSHCRIKLEHVAFYPEPLPEGAPQNAPRSGRFFCHCDFHELFSPRCKSCKTPIEGEVVVALGASWHVGHFFCAECGDPFDSSTRFVERENYAWCLGCYQRRYSTKCKRCRKPVTDTVVKALDAEWHVECFCCTECGSQFDDGRYFLRGGSSQDPVCVRCEEERLKS